MAVNPYENQGQKSQQTAWIDPKTGNMSIVGGSGGDMTRYEMQRADEFLSKGYNSITDPNIIAQLQSGAMKSSDFKSTSEWQNQFSNTAGMVTAPNQSDINSALERLSQYSAYQDYAKPVSSPVSTNNSLNSNSYSQQPSTQSNDFSRMQSEYESRIGALEKMISDMTNTANKNKYLNVQGAQNSQQGSNTVNNGQHVFEPGTQQKQGSNVGYTQGENATNQALFKYLNNMWNGGF